MLYLLKQPPYEFRSMSIGFRNSLRHFSSISSHSSRRNSLSVHLSSHLLSTSTAMTSPQVESSQTQPSAVSASVTVLPHLSISVSTHTVPASILLSKTTLNWLNRAYSLGLRDLYLDIYTNNFESLFPLILTFLSLESLKISSLDLNDSSLYSRSFQPLIPSNFLATGLRSLHLKAKVSCSDLKTCHHGAN